MAFGNGTALQVQSLLTVNGNWTVFPGTATVERRHRSDIWRFNLGGGTLIANANFNIPGSANINNSGLVVNNEFIVAGDLGLNSSEAIINGMLNVFGAANVNSSGLVVNNELTVGGGIDLTGSSERSSTGC